MSVLLWVQGDTCCKRVLHRSFSRYIIFLFSFSEMEGEREPFDEKAAQTKQKQTFLRRPRTFSKNSPKGGKADRGGAVCLFVLSAFFPGSVS